MSDQKASALSPPGLALPLEQVDPAKVILIRNSLCKANGVLQLATDMCRYSEDPDIVFTFVVKDLSIDPFFGSDCLLVLNPTDEQVSEIRRRVIDPIFLLAVKRRNERTEWPPISTDKIKFTRPDVDPPISFGRLWAMLEKSKIVDDSGQLYDWSKRKAEDKIQSATFEVLEVEIEEKDIYLKFRIVHLVMQRFIPPIPPRIDVDKPYDEIGW